MRRKELIERTRRALQEFAKLPPEEQIRRMVAYGTINEKGEVLMGGPDPEQKNGQQENGQVEK